MIPVVLAVGLAFLAPNIALPVFGAAVAAICLAHQSVGLTVLLILIASLMGWRLHKCDSLRLVPRTEERSFPPSSRPKPLEFFVLVLMGLVGWLNVCGVWQLEPPDMFFGQLSRGVGEFGMGGLVLACPGEPWRAGLVVGGALALLVWVACWSFAASVTGNAWSRVVVAAFLTLGSSSALLTPGPPEEVLSRFWIATLLVSAVASPLTWALSLLVQAALAVSFPQILGATIGLIWLNSKKTFTVRWAFLTIALAALAALWVKGPSLSLFSALLVFSLLNSRSDIRPGLQAGFRVLILLELWGPDWRVFGLTALALYLTECLSPFLETREVKALSLHGGELRVSQEKLAIMGFLGLLLIGVLPGEKALNSEVLIASQKARFPLHHLTVPNSLGDWVRFRGAAFGLGSDVQELAERLKSRPEPSVFVRGPIPSYRESAVVSMLAGRPWMGWEVREGAETNLESKLAASFLIRLDSTEVPTMFLPFDEGRLPGAQESDTAVGPNDFPSVLPVSLDVVERSNRCVDARGLAPLELDLRNPWSFSMPLDDVERVWLESEWNGKRLASPKSEVEWENLAPGQEIRVEVALRTPDLPAEFAVVMVFEMSNGATVRQNLSGGLFRSRSAVMRLDLEGGAEL